MYATAIEKEADVVVITEAHRVIDDWYVDKTKTVAIYVTNKGMVGCNDVLHVCSGEGFTGINYKGLLIFSVYSSPNITIQEFESFMITLLEALKPFLNEGKGIILTGDFNSRSPLWGSDRWCNRGRILFQMLSTLDLLPIITEGEVTCDRGKGSKIDVMFCCRKTSKLLTKSVVLEDFTASDHRYILHSFQDTDDRICTERCPVLDLKNIKLDEERFMKLFLHKYGNNSPWPVSFKNKKEDIDIFITDIKKYLKKSWKIKKNNDKKKQVPWWNEEVKDKRKNALITRRKITRIRSKHGQPSEEDIAEYKRCKLELNKSINKAKKESWYFFLKEIEKDTWGKPYKMIKKMVKGENKPVNLDKEEVIKTVNKLFITLPENPDIEVIEDENNEDGINEDTMPEIHFTEDSIIRAAKRINLKKAPGPDGLTSPVTRKMGIEASRCITYIFNLCYEYGYWPRDWKIGRLVLLPKDKPTTGMAEKSYRPLSIISCLAKLFEYLIKDKLLSALACSELAHNQFGFRKGLSTLHAMQNVIYYWQRARIERRHCLLVLLDVKNAFNTVKWSSIIRDLKDRNFPIKLINIIKSYLHDRTIVYDGEDFTSVFYVYGGVPQGSVIGPLLWNVVYDKLLRLKLGRDVFLVGYADDIGVIVVEEDLLELKKIIERTLIKMSKWYENESLTLAHQKTEAILLTGSQVPCGINFKCGNVQIRTSRVVKYLGVSFESNTIYKKHISNISDKALKFANSLSLLLPNVNGAGNLPRRLYYKVVESIILYASPIWSSGIKNRANLNLLRTTQRTALIRTAYAYRTVSAEALCVLTGQIPIDLLITEREVLFKYEKEADKLDDDVKKKYKEEKREETIKTWQIEWEKTQNGRWTFTLIPNIKEWIDWGPKLLNYHLTQVLTGHGCCGTFLCKIGRQETANCWFCQVENDNFSHTLFDCPRWEEERVQINQLLDEDLQIGNIMQYLKNTKYRQIIIQFINKILEKKEEYERNIFKRSKRRKKRVPT